MLPELLKGPPGDKKVIDPSSAHQIFGRAGRPQFDTQGYVFVLAHEDDVKLLRWREKYDSIPEDTKDPQLRKAKKALKKKMPKRRSTEQYWTEAQFDKLRDSPARQARQPRAAALAIARLLARRLTRSRQDPRAGQQAAADRQAAGSQPEAGRSDADDPLDRRLRDTRSRTAQGRRRCDEHPAIAQRWRQRGTAITAGSGQYRPHFAHPTPNLQKLLLLRGVNPLYGVFLVNQLGIADQNERIQALESVLELPPCVAYHLHVPGHEELPPGPLATTRLDIHLLQLGLVTAEQLGAGEQEEPDGPRAFYEEERVYVLTLADKLRMWFDYDFPGVHDLRTRGVWAAGELLEYGGDFNKFITSKRLQKQEGVIFRHLLRLILLIEELTQLSPPDLPRSSGVTRWVKSPSG